LSACLGIATAFLAGSELLRPSDEVSPLQRLSGSPSLPARPLFAPSLAFTPSGQLSVAVTVTGVGAISSASLTPTQAILIGLGTIALLAVVIVLVILLAHHRRAAAYEYESVTPDMSTVYENGFDPTSASCTALQEFENPETMEEAPEV
jgi:hypothetical protein